MGTAFSEIISDFAMVEIDDIRLRQQAQETPALFYRRMWLYLQNAIPLFNRPPEMRAYLLNDLQAPTFDNVEWVSTESSTTEQSVVDTGKTGYELFSCAVVSYDNAGNVEMIPYTDAKYDSESGEVTFPMQAEAGIIYTMDFYSDGSFAKALTIAQKRLLGLCCATVWYERFAGNWLNMQPKIIDKSFETRSEHAWITANTSRLKELRASLSGELMKYEQDCEYVATIKNPKQLKDFV